jgi:hypothetical protein
MSFRKRLLLLFALTIAFVVALSSSVVWVMLRRSFERANEERACCGADGVGVES